MGLIARPINWWKGFLQEVYWGSIDLIPLYTRTGTVSAAIQTAITAPIKSKIAITEKHFWRLITAISIKVFSGNSLFNKMAIKITIEARTLAGDKAPLV